MNTWKRQPQETEGSYFFSGNFYTTRRVMEALGPIEVLSIYMDVLAFVKERNGIDYLQVYTNDTGQKLFFIDQLNKQMIESGKFSEEQNHCTLMFAEEY